MDCRKCGAKNQEDAATCVICGTSLPKSSASPSEGAQAVAGRPAVPVAPRVPGAGAGTPQPPTPLSSTQAPTPRSAQDVASGGVNTYLVPAILTTLFCCLPFGIVSIVYAAQVQGKLAAGDQQGAIKASRSARTWAWVAFGVGLVLTLFYAAGIIIAVVADM